MAGYCKGWGAVGHRTEAPLVTVYVVGCAQCGGLECGDAGELLRLCPGCMASLREADVTFTEVGDERD